MNTPVRLAGFAAAAAAVFGLALVGGRVVGPVADEPAKEGHGAHAPRTPLTPATGETEIPGGLMVAQDGYTLALDADRTAAGEDVPVSFTITGPDGAPVTSYEVQHEKQLHLIAVRRDFSGFQHVHPTLADGVWSTDLDLTPGTWRLFADFKAAGAPALTLGADLAVAGSYEPGPPPAQRRTASVDGYEVTLDGDLTAGADAKLTLSVSKDGAPVTDLQPYLGAYGHLVALRAGDLAYLHVHPDGEPGDGTPRSGPDVVFHTSVPSAGTYHLYLDFQHAGVVRTAAFTVTAGDSGAPASGEQSESPEEKHGESSGHAH